MSKSWQISRRTMLRGLGAMIALPPLEIMGKATGPGSGQPAEAPMRFISLFQPNGVYPKNWDVSGVGKNFTLSPILRPLEKLKNEIVILSGLDNIVGGGHVQMTTSFLTGVSVKNGRSATSLDQQIAQKIGQDTAYQSLVLGTEPPRQGSTGRVPISMAGTVSWSSPTTRIAAEINPRVAFDRLFRGKTGPDAIRRARSRKSVIDIVLSDAKSLRRKASILDQHKLDEYLESVRTVERQLERITNPSKNEESWVPPNPPTDKDIQVPPPGLPARRDEHLRMMMDLMLLAMWTDTTRVCTLMTAHGFSRQNFSFLDGVSRDHHGMSHHKENAAQVKEYTRVSQWYIEQFAYFLDRLKSIDEGSGSLYDNSVVLYGCGMKDGNGHRRKNLPIVVAGGGKGQLQGGRHLKVKSQPLSNLHFTIGQKFGLSHLDFNKLGSRNLDGLFDS